MSSALSTKTLKYDLFLITVVPNKPVIIIFTKKLQEDTIASRKMLQGVQLLHGSVAHACDRGLKKCGKTCLTQQIFIGHGRLGLLDCIVELSNAVCS